MIDNSKFKKIIVDNSTTRNREGKPMLVLYHNYLYLSKTFTQLVRDYKYVNIGAVANCLQLEFTNEKSVESLELKIQDHVNKNNVIVYGKIGGTALCSQLAKELGLPINEKCYYKTTDYENKGSVYQFVFNRNAISYRKAR